MDASNEVMTAADWRVLLDRYTDGMFRSGSPYAAAAQAFKRMVADAVWDEVHAVMDEMAQEGAA